MAKTIIQIFVTRGGTLQVQLTESIDGRLQKSKQVLIGGERWNSGELDEHKIRIHRKVRELITSLHQQSEKILDE